MEAGSRPLLDRIGGVPGVVAALVGAISGIVGLVVLFWPDGDTPRPEIPATRSEIRAPASELGAELMEVALGSRVTLRAYLLEIGASTARYTPEQLRALGHLLHVRAVTRGLANKTLPVVWSIRQRDGTLVSTASKNRPGLVVKPLADTYAAERRIWVPVPRWSGEFFVELALLYRDRELDYAQTDFFPGLGLVSAPVEDAPQVTSPRPDIHADLFPE